MKTIGLLFILFFLLAGCKNTRPGSHQETAEISDTLLLKTTTLRINGMTCTGCENTIKKMVGEIEGVKEVKASFSDSVATVVFDTSMASIVVISETINNLGYEVISEIQPE